jgi:hypothetical protein
MQLCRLTDSDPRRGNPCRGFEIMKMCGRTAAPVPDRRRLRRGVAAALTLTSRTLSSPDTSPDVIGMIRQSDLMLGMAIAVAGSGASSENSAKSHPKMHNSCG